VQRQPPQPLDLSEAEFNAVQEYAQARGISVDQAATDLARQAIVSRFVRTLRKTATVVRFERRKR
jgi:hypothetical protein